MADWKGYKRFYIHIKGQGILNNKIAIRELGLTLNRFQSLYDHIGIISAPKLEKKDMSLYFSSVIESKSVVVEIQHEEKIPTLVKEFEKPDSLFETLFKLVLDYEFNEGLEEFRKLVHSPISRVELLSKLRDFWSTKKRKISIGFGENLSDVNLRKLSYIYKKRIGTWLLKEVEELSKDFRCFITRLKYDFPASFSVMDEDGNIVKGRLTSNIKADVKKYSGELVKIKGILKKKGKEYRFLKIDYIKPIHYIEIEDNVYGLPLFHSLKFSVKLFEDGIVLTEESLNIRLYVQKLSDIATELRDYLEILIEEYIDVPKNSVDQNAIKFRESLIKLFGE